MTEATPALVAEGITSGYGEVPIVQDVSIHVGQDEIVTIIGPNGAGKSTVLKALFGFLPVWQGRVSLAGDDVTGTGAGAAGLPGNRFRAANRQHLPQPDYP